MIIAIDIGNTNIVTGVFENGKLKFMERISTNHTITSLEYAFSFSEIFRIHGTDPRSAEGCIISSVVPDVLIAVSDALERLSGKPCYKVSHKLKTGLDIKIDNPGTLGNDQIVDAVAAIAEYPLPLAVIDMGTATTISIITEGAVYEGGVILPGTRVSLDSLTNRTSQLPKIGIEKPENVIGKNTVDCMKSGIVFGSAAQIDGLIDRFENEIGSHLTAVATGGLAPLIVPYCRHEIICDDSLLMKGLYILYKENF